MFTARFQPVSNRADWSTAIRIFDKATGDLCDATGGDVPLTWTLCAHLKGGRYGWPSLQGSTSTGEITAPSLGILAIFFPATTMGGLEPGSYDISLLVTNGIFTTEIFVGLLPVIGRHLGLPSGYGSFYR